MHFLCCLDPFLDTLINGFSCSAQDEYHIEGEMGVSTVLLAFYDYLLGN